MENNQKALGGETPQGLEEHFDTSEYGLSSLVAIETLVRLSAEELERLRALERDLDEDLLLERLRARIGDYGLIQAAVMRFLKEVR